MLLIWLNVRILCRRSETLTNESCFRIQTERQAAPPWIAGDLCSDLCGNLYRDLEQTWAFHYLVSSNCLRSLSAL